MHEIQNPTASPERVPWNRGKLIGPRPSLRQKDVWAIRTTLQIEQQVRDLALFNLAIDSKLCGCDVVAIRVDDVAPIGHAIARACVRQGKTGRPVRFELTEQTRQAINYYLGASGRKVGDYLFDGRRPGQSITTRQYARLLSGWLTLQLGLDLRVYGTHLLRRTKATLIYLRTGNLRAVPLLLGHTKIESTVRYLGIDVDDALAISEQVDIWACRRPGRERRLCPSILSCLFFWTLSEDQQTFASKGKTDAPGPKADIVFWAAIEGPRLESSNPLGIFRTFNCDFAAPLHPFPIGSGTGS